MAARALPRRQSAGRGDAACGSVTKEQPREQPLRVSARFRLKVLASLSSSRFHFARLRPLPRCPFCMNPANPTIRTPAHGSCHANSGRTLAHAALETLRARTHTRDTRAYRQPRHASLSHPLHPLASWSDRLCRSSTRPSTGAIAGAGAITTAIGSASGRMAGIAPLRTPPVTTSC